jgi:NADH-quinone oxidoreductase subunit E
MDLARIDQIVDKHRAEPSALIQILLQIQAENRWLPKEALERVAERLDVSSAHPAHATFYKAFSLVPRDVIRSTSVSARRVTSAPRAFSTERKRLPALTGCRPRSI